MLESVTVFEYQREYVEIGKKPSKEGSVVRQAEP
jgi:hypothetical protein